MISGDALIQVSATVIVGILFLISLRQALGFRPTGSFFISLVTLAILPFTLTSILVLEDQVEYAKWSATFGFVALTILLYVVAVQARTKETKVR